MLHYAFTPSLLLFAALGNPTAAAVEHLDLGSTSTGATVTMTHAEAGWSIRIDGPGSFMFLQPEPARIEISDGKSGEVRDIDVAYEKAARTSDGVEARGEAHSLGVLAECHQYLDLDVVKNSKQLFIHDGIGREEQPFQ